MASCLYSDRTACLYVAGMDSLEVFRCVTIFVWYLETNIAFPRRINRKSRLGSVNDYNRKVIDLTCLRRGKTYVYFATDEMAPPRLLTLGCRHPLTFISGFWYNL